MSFPIPLVAFGFDTNDVDAVVADVSDGGIFKTKEIKENVSKMKANSTHNDTTKMTMMIEHLLELVYELCPPPRHDVSKNAGFESVLCCFGDTTGVGTRADFAFFFQVPINEQSYK